MNLNDKIIVVTGGCGLIGKEIVKQINNYGGQAITADINVQPDKYNYFCDITNYDSIQDMLKLILKSHKTIDGWVNNAYPKNKDWGRDFEDIDPISWKENVNMHLNGYFNCCHSIFRIMKEQGSGSIINMSSIYGFLGPDFSIYKDTEITFPAEYSAIKGGIINFTRYFASYCGQYNVRVNSISPGGVFDGQSETFVNNYTRKVPLKRMAEPSDIAPTVVYLLSDQSSYITGHNLVIDGGISIT